MGKVIKPMIFIFDEENEKTSFDIREKVYFRLEKTLYYFLREK
jgi:hypothetical protein